MDLEHLKAYRKRLNQGLDVMNLTHVQEMAEVLQAAWKSGARVFICGNGGSAANAMHMANDFLYGIARNGGKGLRVNALPADTSILTCLANDVSYDQVFSMQLATHGRAGDVLIVLSGSGNSKNVVEALKEAKNLGMRSCAILGYSGGACLKLADLSVHVAIDDMQVAEDVQLIVGHMIMRWLCENPA